MSKASSFYTYTINMHTHESGVFGRPVCRMLFRQSLFRQGRADLLIIQQIAHPSKLLPLTSQTKLTITLTLTLLNRNICAHIVDTHNKVFPDL